MSALKHVVYNIPVIGRVMAAAYVWLAEKRFHDSAGYWEARYRRGGKSGGGSYGELAKFKAEVLNELVAQHAVRSVIELGCGDGHQLKLARYPRYLGLDVSPMAVQMCRAAFSHDPTKSFALSRDHAGQTAELALSLDVIFHLVEDDVFVSYMRSLFSAAERLVVIYSSNTDDQEILSLPHVRHRKFTDWIAANEPNWRLGRVVENRFPYDASTGLGSAANFFIYERSAGWGSR